MTKIFHFIFQKPKYFRFICLREDLHDEYASYEWTGEW